MRTTFSHVLIFLIFLVVRLTAIDVEDFNFKDEVSAGREDFEKGIASLFAARLAHLELHQPEIFGQAESLLTALESSPSCTRLATATLLTSCQTLDGSLKDSASSENPEDFLENVKSIYAARLAVCELVGAGAPVPRGCSAMVLPGQQKGKLDLARYLLSHGGQKASNSEAKKFETVDQTQLARCLRSLESRPQWWTSYSNGRQNAFIMCKAVRIDIEKDEVLALHKSMTKVMADVSSKLSETLQESSRHSENQRTFLESVHRFQTQVQTDMEATKSDIRGLRASLAQIIKSVAQSFTDKMQAAFEVAEVNLGLLSKNIRASNDEVKDLRSNVGKVFQEVVSGSSELAAGQTREWEASREVVQEIQSSLQQLKGSEMQELLSYVRTMRSDMQNSTELMVVQKTALKDLADNQSYLQEKQKESFDMAFERVAQLVEIMIILESTMAEIATKVKQINDLGIVKIFNWLYFVLIWLIGFGFSLGAWRILGGRLGKLIICCIGLACLFKTVELPKGSANALSQLSVMSSAAQIRQAHFWADFGPAILGVCVVFAVIFAVLLRHMVARRQNRAGVLPTIEPGEEKSPEQ